jgi:hypothetical protein
VETLQKNIKDLEIKVRKAEEALDTANQLCVKVKHTHK